MPYTGVLAICCKTLADLDSQFAGWSKYKRFNTRAQWFLIMQDLQDRNGKSRRFSCTGLRATKQVLSFQYKGYCLLLNRCRDRIPFCCYCMQNGLNNV